MLDRADVGGSFSATSRASGVRELQFVLLRCGGRHIRDVLNERYNSLIAVFRWDGRWYEPRLLGR